MSLYVQHRNREVIGRGGGHSVAEVRVFEVADGEQPPEDATPAPAKAKAHDWQAEAPAENP